MADPLSSLSSESEDEESLQFSNTFDDKEVPRADSFQILPPDSDSDDEVPIHSLYDIRKPFHIPGTVSNIPINVDVTRQPELDIQETDVSIQLSKNQSIKFCDIHREEDDDKMEETEVFPSHTIDAQLPENADEHGESIQSIQAKKSDMESVQQHSATEKLSKPVFKVADIRKCLLGTAEGDESKSDISLESRNEDLFGVNDEVEGNEIAQNKTLGEEKEGKKLDDNTVTDQTDIITESMCEDINQSEETCDYSTSLTGLESFAVISMMKENEDNFYTPTEGLSNDEEYEEDISDKEETEYDDTLQGQTETNVLEETALENKGISTDKLVTDSQALALDKDLNGFEQSFFVIGKGSFSESRHEYKSISSSISEGELLKSGERFSNEMKHDQMQENTLSFRDKLKLFEEGLKEKVEEDKTSTASNTKNNDQKYDNDNQTEMQNEFGQASSSITDSKLSSFSTGEAIMEAGRCDESSTSDDRPPVPPKSDIVLESLRSFHVHETELSLEESEVDSHEQKQNVSSETDSQTTLKGEQQLQRNTVHSGQFATHGPTSMPHSQSDPIFTPWGFFQQYPQGYFPGNQPQSYDLETYQRIQFLQYQQFFFHQQMLARQGTSMNQNTNVGNDSDYYRTQNPEFRQYRQPFEQGPRLDTSETCQQSGTENIAVQKAAQDSYVLIKDSDESLSTLKDEAPISNAAEYKRKDGENQNTHATPEIQRRTKQQGQPVPKPRKSLATKPKEEPDKSRIPSRGDSGLSQPINLKSSIDNTRPFSPGAKFDKPKINTKPKQLPQQPKISPKQAKVPGQKVNIKKSNDSTEKVITKTGRSLPQEETKPITPRVKRTEDKSNQETLIFIKNINQNSSTENLENFLEGGAGNDAEVKENTTIYSRSRTEALVTFIGKPVVSELNQRCNQTLDGNRLKVCEVPEPTCIAVSSDEEIQSTDAVSLYFESAKHGGGELATDKVLESDDGSCKIIQFKSADVVKRLCSREQHHVVSGATLKVSPYYKCQLGEIWDTALHYIRFPDSYKIPLPKLKLQFLSRQCCQDLKDDLSDKFADMEYVEDGLKLNCTLTQRTPNCRAIAKTWSEAVKKRFDAFISKLAEKNVTVATHVWDGLLKFLDEGDLNKDTLLIEMQREQGQIFLCGMEYAVDEAYEAITTAMNNIDRTVRRTSKLIHLKTAARVRLLSTMGVLADIESAFTDLTLGNEDRGIRLDGVAEDIRMAELKVHEANNDLKSKKFSHTFTSRLTNFVNQQHTKIYSFVMEQLKSKDIIAEFEVTNKDCVIIVPSDGSCNDVQRVVFDAMNEVSITLEDESLPLLDGQKWEEVCEDITEKFENTANFDVNEAGRVIYIFGLSKDVIQAKTQIDNFFEKFTIKTELFPLDKIYRNFTEQFNTDKVKEIERILVAHSVSINLSEKGVMIKATKEGITKAKQQMKQLLSLIKSKDHVCKKIGVTDVLNNLYLQGHLAEIGCRTRCLIDTPMSGEMTRTIHYGAESEASYTQSWQDEEEEFDLERNSSSVDEPPGFKTKNGAVIFIVKGELGKQEGNVIVCSTSQNLKLGSGAAGKSLLREGGHMLQDECDEIVQSNGEQKYGQIVQISAGKMECNQIYLTSLPPWKDDSSSIQILVKIVTESLTQASNDSHRSILFCALGTGGLKYPADAVAEVMYNTVIEFDAVNPHSSLKEVKFVLYQKDFPTIQAFEKQEKQLKMGGEKINDDLKYGHVTVELAIEQLSSQKVDGILCTTNKEMNLKASGACKALLDAAGPTLLDECTNKYQNNLSEGLVADIKGGKLNCQTVFLTVLPVYKQGGEATLKDVMITVLGLAQSKKFKSLACIALGTGYLKYPKGIVAKTMYDAVQSFVSANPATCIQRIKFVMHAKDRDTIQTFRSYVQQSKRITNRGSRTFQPGRFGSRQDNNKEYNALSDGCQIRHIGLKVVTGDLLKEKTDVIVNSVTSDFKFVGGVASALVKTCPKLQQLNPELRQKMKLKGIATTKHGKDLIPKLVIHVAFQSTIEDWKQKIRHCLEKAEKKKLRSISFPVLGTGAGSRNFKAEEIAGCMFDAIDEFSKGRSCKYLQEIRLVIFHMQSFMREAIVGTICKKSQEKAAKTSTGLWSKISGVASEVKKAFSGRSEEEQTKELRGVSAISLKIYSDSEVNLDRCITEISAALDQEYTDYTLDAYKELVKQLSKEELDELENIPLPIDMKIDRAAGIIKIMGPNRHVSNAQSVLYERLKIHDRCRQQTEEADTLFNLIQWHYEEITPSRMELLPYDKMTNLRIEHAYKARKANIELADHLTGVVYVLDFGALKEYEKNDKENTETRVVRKDVLKSAIMPLPLHWTNMKDDENIRIEAVLPSDPKYKELEQRFVNEVSGGSFNNRPSSVKNVQVTKIDRIQNKTLYQQYAAKKEQMEKQTPKPAPQFPIERSVWHGTTADCLTSIYTHGFNRSFCGKNGIWYGAGVYFAADASYSARSWLSGASGSGGSKGYIFLVKALTGEYCKGNDQMRFLPPKNPNDKSVLYDCAVDNEANPQEFVIFHDTQAYPEYMISFTT